MNPEVSLPYLEGYSPAVQARVRTLLDQDKLGAYLRDRYSETHAIRTDKALAQAAQALKDRFLKNTPPLHKVRYDAKLLVMSELLGLHTRISRVQGSRLKASREIRVATEIKVVKQSCQKIEMVFYGYNRDLNFFDVCSVRF